MKSKFILGLIILVLAYSVIASTVVLLRPAQVIYQIPLGAEGDTNLTNIVLSGDLTVDGVSTLTGSVTMAGATTTVSDEVVQAGRQTRVTQTSLTAAAHESFIQNPFAGATSTARLVSFNQTGASATSTVVRVGTSTASTVLSLCVATCLINATSSTYAAADIIATNTRIHLIEGESHNPTNNSPFTNPGVRIVKVGPAQGIIVERYSITAIDNFSTGNWAATLTLEWEKE